MKLTCKLAGADEHLAAAFFFQSKLAKLLLPSRVIRSASFWT
jgi:hypothetical protein